MTVEQVRTKMQLEEIKIRFNRLASRKHSLDKKAQEAFGHTAKLIRQRAHQLEEEIQPLKKEIIKLASQLHKTGEIPRI